MKQNSLSVEFLNSVGVYQNLSYFDKIIYNILSDNADILQLVLTEAKDVVFAKIVFFTLLKRKNKYQAEMLKITINEISVQNIESVFLTSFKNRFKAKT